MHFYAVRSVGESRRRRSCRVSSSVLFSLPHAAVRFFPAFVPAFVSFFSRPYRIVISCVFERSGWARWTREEG